MSQVEGDAKGTKRPSSRVPNARFTPSEVKQRPRPRKKNSGGGKTPKPNDERLLLLAGDDVHRWECRVQVVWEEVEVAEGGARTLKPDWRATAEKYLATVTGWTKARKNKLRKLYPSLGPFIDAAAAGAEGADAADAAAAEFERRLQGLYDGTVRQLGVRYGGLAR